MLFCRCLSTDCYSAHFDGGCTGSQSKQGPPPAAATAHTAATTARCTVHTKLHTTTPPLHAATRCNSLRRAATRRIKTRQCDSQQHGALKQDSATLQLHSNYTQNCTQCCKQCCTQCCTQCYTQNCTQCCCTEDCTDAEMCFHLRCNYTLCDCLSYKVLCHLHNIVLL